MRSRQSSWFIYLFIFIDRYQRVSPDCVPLASNGKRPNGGTIHQTAPPSTTTNINSNPIASSSSPFEPSKALRFRSPSRTPERNSHFEGNEGSPSDVLLQWGHRKRPRASRTEIRAPLTDDSSSSSSAQARHSIKPQRRLVGPTAASMPPPPPTVPHSSNGRARKEVSASLLTRFVVWILSWAFGSRFCPKSCLLLFIFYFVFRLFLFYVSNWRKFVFSSGKK